MFARAVFARATASAVLAGVLLIGTAGCSAVTTVATQIPYNPSDGVTVSSGPIKVINIIGLTDDGADVSLIFSASNATDEAAAFTIQWEVDGTKTSERVTVPANSLVSYGTDEQEPLVLRDVNVQLGSLFPIYFQSGTEPGSEAMVPILDGTFPEYSDLLPTPVPTPTAGPQDSEETPAP